MKRELPTSAGDAPAPATAVKEDDSPGPLHAASGLVDCAHHRLIRAGGPETSAVALSGSALLAGILGGIREACFVLDREWRLIFLNDRAELVCGIRTEALGKSWWELSPALTGTAIEADCRRAMTGRVAFTFKAIFPANQRWQDVRLSPFEDGLMVFLNDVHDREIAERARRNAEDELHRAQQIARVGSWYRDLATDRIEATPELCRIFGRMVIPPFPEQIGTMYSPEAWKQLAGLRELVREGKGGDLEVPALRGDGAEIRIHTRWDPVTDADGKVVGIRGIVQDITEHHQAEEAVRQGAAELATLMESVPVPIFIAHDPGGIHLSRNRAADELLRNPADRQTGSAGPVDGWPQYLRIFQDGRELRHEEFPAERAARGEFVQDCELSLVFDDGSTREVIAHAVPLWDEAVRPRGSISVLVDETERKRLRVALEARRDELLSFVRDAPAAIAMLDRQMNYLAVSERWIADYGQGHRQLEGLNLYQIHPDLPEKWVEIHRKGLQGEIQACENDEWTRADGLTIYLRWSVSPWRDERGKIGGLMILTQDITPRMTAERALRESEERLRLALEASRLRPFAIDVPAGAADWNRIEWALMGCDPGGNQPRPESCGCRMHPEDVTMLRARWAEAQSKGEFEAEFRVLDADATVRWLAGRGRFVQPPGQLAGAPDGRRRFLGVNFDITDRKRAELVAAESRLVLDAVVGSAMDAIISTDATQRIVQFNAAAERILECAAEVAIGTPLERFIPDAFRANPSLDRVGAAPGNHRSAELVTARRAGGDPFLAEISISGGEVGGRAIRIFVLRDVSDRVRLEQEVLEVGLREQQRIGSELHDDICQRLVALEFMVSALARELAREAPDKAAQAAQAGAQVRSILNATRFLARGMASSALAADALVVAIRELLPNVRESFGIRCHYDGPESLRVHDELTSFHLLRIVQEAISNAVRHGRASEVGVSIRAEPGRGTLTIRDNGCGFPAAPSAHAGMGLRTMRYRVAQIGGKMEIRRGPERGTEVVCTFAIGG